MNLVDIFLIAMIVYLVAGGFILIYLQGKLDGLKDAQKIVKAFSKQEIGEK